MFKIRPIVKEGSNILRKISTDVELPLNKEDEETLIYMSEYLEKTADEQFCKENNCRAGVGLAAPQIGINKNMVAIRIEDYDKNDNIIVKKYALVNPKIVSHSQAMSCLRGGEGCLSVDNDRQGYVYRYSFVTVEAYDYITKSFIKKKFRGYEAIVVQHELDHLKGVLYFDHINKKDPYKELENGTIL